MGFDDIDRKFRKDATQPVFRSLGDAISGHAEEPYCHACEDGGWEHSWGPEGRGPYFTQCTKCGNPNDHPRP